MSENLFDYYITLRISKFQSSSANKFHFSKLEVFLDKTFGLKNYSYKIIIERGLLHIQVEISNLRD